MHDTKAIVTVAEMARMCGLSRARFYQLQGTAFPLPVYDVTSKRPIYTEEQQRICLDVRKRNCGIDGRPILFYSRGPSAPIKVGKAKPKKDNTIMALVEGLKSLGLATATADQVEQVTRSLYPQGFGDRNQGDVLRAVFLTIRRQNSSDNVGR